MLEADSIKKSQFEVLERISGFTAEQAKAMLLNQLDEELTHEKAAKFSTMKVNSRRNPKNRKKDYLSCNPALCRRPGGRVYCLRCTAAQ